MFAIALVFHPFWSHLIAFNDFGLFTNAADHSDKLSSIWWDSFRGIYSFNGIVELLQFLFEYISFGNNLLAQFLFVFTFSTIGYFGFRKVLLILQVKPILSWIIPFVYVFNPNTFIYSTGVLVFYSLIPYFFVLFWLLFHKYRYWQGFLLSIIVAIYLANYQITFWNVGWIYFFFGMLSFYQRDRLKNYLYIVLHSIGGLLMNLVSVQPFLGYVQNVANVDNQSYLQSFHGCYPALFWNLARIGANGCNLMGALGYIKDNYWNITGYILVIIILLALYRWKIWQKSMPQDNKIILLMSVSFVSLVLLLAILLRFRILDFLIIQNNPIIVSLRNPVKLLEPFVFHYLILVSLAFHFLLVYWKKTYGNILLILFCLCMLVYNHPFLMPMWKYQTMNTQNYWVKFAGEGSFYRTNKYDIIDSELTKIPDNTFALYLPLDLSISLKTAWQKTIFRDQSDIMRQKIDQNLAKQIYTSVCNNDIDAIQNLRLNINYIIVDKTPQTTFDHQSKAPIVYSKDGCQVEYDQVYHIWAKPEYFINNLKEKKVWFENDDFVIYQIDNKHIPLFDADTGKISYQKVSNSEFRLQLTETEATKVGVLFQNTYHPGWKIKVGEQVYTAQEKNNNIFFDFSFNPGKPVTVYFEPQETYQKLVISSLVAFGLQLLPVAYFFFRNRSKLTKTKPSTI